MNKESLVRKMEEGVASIRGLLNQNDGSTIQTISSTMRHGFESLKTVFVQNDRAQKAVTEIKSKFEELENAVIAGDKELSKRLLDAVEKKIAEYKNKKTDDTAPQDTVIELPPVEEDVAGKEKEKM